MDKAQIKENCKEQMLACDNFIIFRRFYLRSKDVQKFEEVFNEVHAEKQKPKKRGRPKAEPVEQEQEEPEQE